MFASLEKDDQTDVATKWYHRTVKEKDIRHYQLLAQYTKEENQTLKKRLRDNIKKRDKEIKKLVSERKQEFRKKEKELKKMKDIAIQQSKANMSQNYDKLLRQHVLELNHYRNTLEKLQTDNKNLNLRIDELEDQKWKLHKIVGKYQQEVKQ